MSERGRDGEGRPFISNLQSNELTEEFSFRPTHYCSENIFPSRCLIFIQSYVRAGSKSLLQVTGNMTDIPGTTSNHMNLAKLLNDCSARTTRQGKGGHRCRRAVADSLIAAVDSAQEIL